jgi:hypothetical protein
MRQVVVNQRFQGRGGRLTDDLQVRRGSLLELEGAQRVTSWAACTTRLLYGIESHIERIRKVKSVSSMRYR